MKSFELRKKFLDFFKEKEHRIVSSSSLLPPDPTVLFTVAGMQQFKEYFVGKKDPIKDFSNNKLTSCQKCFRTSDIEEVGDNRHLTFLEMLGNFSFGSYFKKEAIDFSLEFLTKICKLKPENLYFTYFKGDKKIPEDITSKKIWLSLGIPKNKILAFDKEDNFWGPTGKEGPCGPTTEIHYDSTRRPCAKGKDCLPNCECGRFIELWNLVFNEYYQDEKGKLTLLKQKGVDTGMGLERLAMASQEKLSVFETDLFLPIIQEIEKLSSEKYEENKKTFRIIADHIRGSVFLINEGIFPSNIEQGYVLRRILRRAIRYGRIIETKPGFLIPLANKTIEIYKDIYPELLSKQPDILTVIQKEEEKFEKALEKGIRETSSMITQGDISGRQAFDLYQNYGFPIEMIEEMAKEHYRKVDKQGFEKAFRKHQEVSRAGKEKKFGGGGKFSPKLHTATHLLHSALRKVLGNKVKQMGSDITSERLRFDFSFERKLSPEELKKIEDLVNKKIKEDLEVKKEEMPYNQAIKSGALAFFKEKYPERVFVYSIDDPSAGSGQVFSKEICAGPHVKRTGELGKFKIIKEESSSAGIRRIKAVLE